MVAGVVVIAAPFAAVRDVTAGRRTLSRVVGLGLVTVGAVLVTKPMFGPLLNGVRFLCFSFIC